MRQSVYKTIEIEGDREMTSDNWLALFMIGVVVVTIYGLLTAPEITPEERKSMEEEWWG